MSDIKKYEENSLVKKPGAYKEAGHTPTRYKVAYFRAVNVKLNESGMAETVNPRLPPEIELCLIPETAEIVQQPDSGSAQLFSVPAGAKIIRLKAGDLWPFGVPNSNFWKFDDIQSTLLGRG